MHNNEIINSLSFIINKLTDLELKINNIERQVQNVKQQVNHVSQNVQNVNQKVDRIELTLENEINQKIDALFDGYALVYEKNAQLENKLIKIKR